MYDYDFCDRVVLWLLFFMVWLLWNRREMSGNFTAVREFHIV